MPHKDASKLAVHDAFHGYVNGCAQLMFSGIDVGVVRVEDFCQAVLDGRVKLPAPHTFGEKLRRLVSSSVPDAEHRVSAIMDSGSDSGRPPKFVALLSTGTMEQVV